MQKISTSTFGFVVLLLLAGCLLVHASSCGGRCNTNNDCSDPKCSRCEGGLCTKGLLCAAFGCTDNTDCNQVGNCTSCYGGKCIYHCGQACKNDGECKGRGCTTCVKGRCQLWKCGLKCTDDFDCTMLNGYGCQTCDYNPTRKSGICKSACGSPCVSSSECRSNCRFCTNGTCSTWP